MKSHVKRVLDQAERQAERLAAYVRFGAFGVMAALVFAMRVRPDVLHVLTLSIAVYGFVTLAGVVLAHLRYYRPSLPWLFVTLDVFLVIQVLAMMTLHIGMPFAAALGVPGAWLIFLFLAYAAMRYRPWLVAYTAILFVVVWVAFFRVLGDGVAPSDFVALDNEDGPFGLTAAYGRLGIMMLVAAVLVVTVARTRRLLLSSIVEARQRANLSRYFSPNLTEALALGAFDAAQEGQRADAAVMFVDIHGFTAIAETMAPATLIGVLNEFRTRVTSKILEFEGTIDKYIGDSVMAVFGVPQMADNPARRALDCALAIGEVLADWRDQRHAAGEVPILAGTGIHYGEVIAAVLGDENRLEFTVIGDTVNAAQRIEALTRQLETSLLVSAELLEAAGEPLDGGRFEPVPPQTVRGRSRPLQLFRPKTIAATVAA